MQTKPILQAAVGLQSLAVLGNATKMLPKFKKGKVIAPKPKKLVKGSVETILGVGLIKPTAKMVIIT